MALLIGMYSVFELSFDKKSRTVRFLYCVLNSEKQFLSNSIRVLIKEKNIEVIRQRAQPAVNYYNPVLINTETRATELESRMEPTTDVSPDSIAESSLSNNNQTTNSRVCTDNYDIASNLFDDINE